MQDSIKFVFVQFTCKTAWIYKFISTTYCCQKSGGIMCNKIFEIHDREQAL